VPGERIYYDRGSVLRQLGVFHEPRSLLGQICIVATHPITMSRAFVKGSSCATDLISDIAPMGFNCPFRIADDLTGHLVAVSQSAVSWERGGAPRRDGVYNWPMFLSELIDLRISGSPTDATLFFFSFESSLLRSPFEPNLNGRPRAAIESRASSGENSAHRPDQWPEPAKGGMGWVVGKRPSNRRCR
jgi:hypothetical protein